MWAMLSAAWVAHSPGPSGQVPPPRIVPRAAADPAPWPARIVHLSSSGFMARIDAWGLEGFVDLRKDPEKFSFDKWQATLTSKTRRFQLEAPVAVTLAGIDREGDHLAYFEPAPGEGVV